MGGSHLRTLQHPGRDGCYHGLDRKNQGALQAPVLAHPQWLGFGGAGFRPGLAVAHSRQNQLEPPIEFGDVARWLHYQHLPAPLRAAQHLGLQGP